MGWQESQKAGLPPWALGKARTYPVVHSACWLSAACVQGAVPGQVITAGGAPGIQSLCTVTC